MEEQVKQKKSLKMPLILVVVWLLIIALFGYSLWLDRNDNSDSSIYEEVSLSSDDTNSTAISAPPVDMSEAQKEQAGSRDSKRLNDIKSMRAALESYRHTNGNYPAALEDLVPDYFEFLPVNPSPGGKPYNYTGIGSEPFTYYDISYVLEIGAEGIDPGMHIANPSGLAAP
ncbi:hypothetical protein KKF61_05470 [Patescibacteria group bacterium]|nr:hypothetical protein [Patescibacteria group bacterium]MBU0963559.1 hypothetical protein [Patescibacteria group bacterium]